MVKGESMYAFYKYDIHKNLEPTITAKTDDTLFTSLITTAFLAILPKG